MQELVDAHCHLQDARLAPDRDAALARARAAGVARMVCNGTRQSDWGDVSALAGLHAAVLPAFGLHPWYIAQRTPDWARELRARLVRDPSASVGEIGLDQAVPGADRAEQALVFGTQLEIAATLGRPACIHCRRAWEPLLAALERAALPRCGFLLHAYSGSVERIRPLIAAGAYFSFSGSLTHASNRRAQSAAAAVPIERLLIETDAPDLLPVLPPDAAGAQPDPRTQPNEPANLPHVLRALAALRGLPADTLAAHLWRNAQRLFVTREPPA